MRLGGKAMPSLCEEGVSGLAFRFNQHLSSKSEESFNEALDPGYMQTIRSAGGFVRAARVACHAMLQALP